MAVRAMSVTGKTNPMEADPRFLEEPFWFITHPFMTQIKNLRVQYARVMPRSFFAASWLKNKKSDLILMI
jgi:hypothetical protein